MAEMKFYTHEEMLDRVVGKKGTLRRSRHEEEINTFLMRETFKQPKQQEHLLKSL